MSDKYNILIVDDDPNQGGLLRSYLEATSLCLVNVTQSAEDFWKTLTLKSYDVMFLDYKIPGTTGLEILSELSKSNNKIPVIMMTGEGSQYIAARAIQSGAFDYLVKGDYALSSLPALIQTAVQMHNLQKSVERSLEQVQFHSLIVSSQ